MSRLNNVMNDAEMVAHDLFCVSAEDFKWLIKQAEKVEELERLKSLINQSWGKSVREVLDCNGDDYIKQKGECEK